MEQTNPTDGDVPTGCIIKYFEIQYACGNLSAVAGFVNCAIQYKLAGQTLIDPDVAGGDDQRNQILHMDNFAVGQNQNSTHKFKFKVPKSMQRIRQGTQWALSVSNSVTLTEQIQVIYKFYT